MSLAPCCDKALELEFEAELPLDLLDLKKFIMYQEVRYVRRDECVKDVGDRVRWAAGTVQGVAGQCSFG